MALRRGFKAEADRIGIALRSDLGLFPTAPMNFDALSLFLSVPIVPLGAFRVKCAVAFRQLVDVDPGAFSAVTLPDGDRGKFILHNDSHSLARQQSNLAHEFSHIVLGHPMVQPLDAAGCRRIDRDIEDEASWLSGAILIPNAAAIHIVRTGMTQAEACRDFGVSAQMLRFRINASGARLRVARSTVFTR